MRSIEEYKQRVREIDHEMAGVSAVEVDEDAERLEITLDYRGVADILGPLTLGRQNMRCGSIAAVLRAEEPGLDITVRPHT